MSDNNNNTENHKSVKDLFENFEVQPGQHVWDNIINSVHSINAAKIKRTKIIATATAIAFAVSVVAIIMLNNHYVQDSPTATTNIITASSTANNKNSLEPIGVTDSTAKIRHSAEDNSTTSEQTIQEQQTQQTEKHNLPTTAANNNNSNTPDNIQPIPTTEMATNDANTHTAETNNNNTPNVEPEKTETNHDTTKTYTNINKTQPNNNVYNSKTDNDTITIKPTTTPHTNKTNNSNSDRDGVIYVPTAFTPDQTDNNRFFVKGKNIKDYEIRIMSKAKVLVYSSTDINEQWDGTHNGEALDRGMYIYMIVFTDLNNKVHHKNGTITLIRQN